MLLHNQHILYLPTPCPKADELVYRLPSHGVSDRADKMHKAYLRWLPPSAALLFPQSYFLLTWKFQRALRYLNLQSQILELLPLEYPDTDYQ